MPLPLNSPPTKMPSSRPDMAVHLSSQRSTANAPKKAPHRLTMSLRASSLALRGLQGSAKQQQHSGSSMFTYLGHDSMAKTA